MSPRTFIAPYFDCGDSGRAASGFIQERADCTVRATAEAYAVSYATAHAACKAAGRQEGKALNYLFATEAGLFAHLGSYKIELSFERRRVYTVLPLLDKSARYVVRIKGHVFAVINGKIKDNSVWSGGAIVKQVWKITPHSHRPGPCIRGII
jgi:hypothetical protein